MRPRRTDPHEMTSHLVNTDLITALRAEVQKRKEAGDRSYSLGRVWEEAAKLWLVQNKDCKS